MTEGNTINADAPHRQRHTDATVETITVAELRRMLANQKPDAECVVTMLPGGVVIEMGETR